MLTRRELGKLALALPAAKVFGDTTSVFGAMQTGKPNSKIEGVQIGLIAPYSFGQEANDADTILKYVTQLGISAIELQNGPMYAGAPAGIGRGGGRGPGGPGGRGGPGGPGGGPGGPGGPGGAPGAAAGQGQGGQPGAPPGPGGPGGRRGRAEMTPEQQAAQREAQEAMKKWRLSQSMDKFKELRKKYSNAGVSIYAFKLGLSQTMSDEEYDYVFNVGEALGANHITMELPTDSALTRRIGDFAAKRKMLVGYHTHMQATLTIFDEALTQSKYNAINVDIGHYVGGTSESPIPLILKHHSRFASIHLKDKTKGNNPAGGDQNKPWGQGDTSIKEVLQLMKKNKYTWPATIELEYPVPEGSTRVAEIAKCFQYCKDALTAKTSMA